MIIKMNVSIDSYSLKINEIINSETSSHSEEFLKSLSSNGFAKELKSDEIKETTIDDWQEKEYPNNMAVFKDGNIYRANVGDGNFTSTSWIYSTVQGEPSEWVIKVLGN